jgi:hypothetical protein
MRALFRVAAVVVSLVAAGIVPATSGAQSSSPFTIKSQVGRTITVTVPGPGSLTFQQKPLPPGVGLVTRGFYAFRLSSASATIAGDVTLPILLNRSGKRQLHDHGKLKRTGEVTFTPTGGTPSAIDLPIRLRIHHHN